MSEATNRLIEQRQLRRGIMQLLAGPLEGEARVSFLEAAEAKLNRDLPPPGRHHMRLYLRSVAED